MCGAISPMCPTHNMPVNTCRRVAQIDVKSLFYLNSIIALLSTFNTDGFVYVLFNIILDKSREAFLFLLVLAFSTLCGFYR